jgi:hypothetical protein
MTTIQKESAQPEETQRLAWVKNIFATADKLDLEAYVNSFTEDGSFQAGNESASVGRSAIRQAGGKIFLTVKAMRHDILQIWLEKDAAIIEARVHYTRLDDKVVVIPCVTILRTQGDLIQDARIFINAAPVFAG